MIFSLIKHTILVLSTLSLAHVSFANKSVEEQHMKVVMRMVGHEFLLEMGDSTTRIPPIKKVDGRYRIMFERSIAVEADLLSFVATKVFQENNLPAGYIMEVEACETHEVVYSYEESPADTLDIIPCKSRPLPTGCYEFYFTFLDQQQAVVKQQLKDKSADATIYFLGVLVLFGAGGIMYYLKKKRALKDDHRIAIGEYMFDEKAMKLFLKSEEFELSSKETDLLALFMEHKNETIEREVLLNKVWNDEGDYIGRTLDVSVSKLRKKLAQDANIKIVNIRGVGYRLTVND